MFPLKWIRRSKYRPSELLEFGSVTVVHVAPPNASFVRLCQGTERGALCDFPLRPHAIDNMVDIDFVEIDIDFVEIDLDQIIDLDQMIDIDHINNAKRQSAIGNLINPKPTEPSRRDDLRGGFSILCLRPSSRNSHLLPEKTMTSIALIVILGVIALGILCAFITSRRAERLAAARQHVETEQAIILRKAEQTDEALAAALENGVAIDQAISEYHLARAGLLLARDRSSDAWNWDADDLERWKEEELARRGEAVNRRLMLPAIGAALAIIAITSTTSVIIYSFSVSRPAASTGAPAAAPVPGTTPAFLPPPPPSGLPAPADPNATPSDPNAVPGLTPATPNSTTPNMPATPSSAPMP